MIAEIAARALAKIPSAPGEQRIRAGSLSAPSSPRAAAAAAAAVPYSQPHSPRASACTAVLVTVPSRLALLRHVAFQARGNPRMALALISSMFGSDTATGDGTDLIHVLQPGTSAPAPSRPRVLFSSHVDVSNASSAVSRQSLRRLSDFGTIVQQQIDGLRPHERTCLCVAAVVPSPLQLSYCSFGRLMSVQLL